MISAVMAATEDYVKQDVFALAKKADPRGKRTIGVLTKCDENQKDGSGLVSVSRKLHSYF